MRSSLRDSESTEARDLHENRASALSVARSISSSLRSRFKQAFGRPASGIPPQHMDASRAHFGDDVFGGHGNGGFDNYHSDDLAEQRRQGLYHSPWHEAVDEDDTQNLQTIIPVNLSNSSLAASSKSRVTSWTNTTISEPTHETLIERKRLSVIQEDGDPHQPSSSAGTHLGGVSVLRKPLPGQVGRGPDPQRLYSALVRRMNQESADRAREPLDNLQEHDEEPYAAVTRVDHPLVPTISSSNTMEQLERQQTTPDLDSGGIEQRGSYLDHYTGNPKLVASKESVYSRTTNGGTDSQFDGRITGVDSDVPYGDHTLHLADPRTHRWVDKSNPFFGSDVWGIAQPSTETFSVPEEEEKTQYHPLNSASTASNIKYRDGSTLPTSSPTFTNVGVDFKNVVHETAPTKATSHVREQAQIQTDQSIIWSRQESGKATTKRNNQSHRKARGAESTGTRTPSPPAKMPDQLSVAKRRFPLLNVKQVTKETPIASRSSSLTRSQSGLLQEFADPGGDHIQDGSEFGKQKTFSSSLRKMSQNNVAKLLKEKRSMAFLGLKSNDKENRSGTTVADVVVPDEVEAASTPGPAYLAMRSGNSDGRKVEKEQTIKEDSPTGLVKATLSARLSRPFNMDTPEGNRPFDSMYLGKRELGFSDTSGGRLSVANKQTIYGCNKQRSFERGPGGYGGLGPPPFGTPPKNEEETALPHLPTPESNRAKPAIKSGLSLGSKRIVSNFLRSRRKGNSSETDTPSIAHREYAAVKASEDATTSSPLFI